MKSFLIFLTSAFILFGLSCKHTAKNPAQTKFTVTELEKPPYFDCNYYSYFHDTTYPYITEEEEKELDEYSKKIGERVNNRYYNLSFLPRIRGSKNFQYVDRLYTSRGNFNYKSLSWGELYDLTTADAVVVGKVIDKKYPNDTVKCLFFKVIYIIEVQEVIHSYFKLKPGNLLMVKNIMGFEGACYKAMKNVYSSFSHIYDYDIGQTTVFSVHKDTYYSRFIMMKFDSNNVFQDTYCHNSFTLPITNSNYSLKDSIKYHDIKSFFNDKVLLK